MTTYTGRKREPNTLVFGNQMVVDQGVNAMLELTKQMLTGTWKPVPNDPATQKKEVSGVCRRPANGRGPASQCLAVATSRERSYQDALCFTACFSAVQRVVSQAHLPEKDDCKSCNASVNAAFADMIQLSISSATVQSGTAYSAHFNNADVLVLIMGCAVGFQDWRVGSLLRFFVWTRLHSWAPTFALHLFPCPQVYLECLNSVAPAPLNWKMWCPGTDAKVLGWQDKSGAAHRQITLRPQKGMTSTMYQWFITSHVLGLMPPVVEFQGNVRTGRGSAGWGH